MKYRSKCGASRVIPGAILNLELPASEKSQHTLSNCIRCFEVHQYHQQQFTLKPQYHPQPAIIIDRARLLQQGAKAFTTNTVLELNRVYTNEANCSFTEALVQDRSLGLEWRKTSSERRWEKRQLHREVTKKVAELFSENAAITTPSQRWVGSYAAELAQ